MSRAVVRRAIGSARAIHTHTFGLRIASHRCLRTPILRWERARHVSAAIQRRSRPGNDDVTRSCRATRAVPSARTFLCHEGGRSGRGPAVPIELPRVMGGATGVRRARCHARAADEGGGGTARPRWPRLAQAGPAPSSSQPAVMLVKETRHPKSLDAWAVSRVATLRDAHGMAFPDIAAKVRNVSGENPTPRTCANAYWALKAARRRLPPRYWNCGRRAGWAVCARGHRRFGTPRRFGRGEAGCAPGPRARSARGALLVRSTEAGGRSEGAGRRRGGPSFHRQEAREVDAGDCEAHRASPRRAPQARAVFCDYAASRPGPDQGSGVGREQGAAGPDTGDGNHWGHVAELGGRGAAGQPRGGKRPASCAIVAPFGDVALLPWARRSAAFSVQPGTSGSLA